MAKIIAPLPSFSKSAPMSKVIKITKSILEHDKKISMSGSEKYQFLGRFSKRLKQLAKNGAVNKSIVGFACKKESLKKEQADQIYSYLTAGKPSKSEITPKTQIFKKTSKTLAESKKEFDRVKFQKELNERITRKISEADAKKHGIENPQNKTRKINPGTDKESSDNSRAFNVPAEGFKKRSGGKISATNTEIDYKKIYVSQANMPKGGNAYQQSNEPQRSVDSKLLFLSPEYFKDMQNNSDIDN